MKPINSPFLLAHASHTDWELALQQCIQQLDKHHGAADPTAATKPGSTLGFIYVTDPYASHFKKIINKLETHFPTIDWIGTIGLSICVSNIEYADQAAMAIMLTDIEKTDYRIFKEQATLQNNPDKNQVQFAIVHGDPRNPMLTEQIETLAETLEPGYLVGGLTSANNYFYQYANGITEGGLSGVIFKHTDKIMTGLSQGCTPISKIFTLTKCEHHMAISIDNRPALDVFKENIGEILARDINRAAGYIFAGFPVPGSDTGDYLVRNIIGLDPHNHYIAIADDLKPNSPIMFCKRDSQTAIDDLKRMLTLLKQRLEESKKPAKGALFVSCIGRGQHMFGDVSNEMKYITEILGDIPTIGFYANGEIAGQRLYGFTGVLTIFL
ncbi:FIST C-terminal domain-containing protein [Beggiatoa alba]|nr:FIST C-terminal domain-containing protein [Beggiatoa alba]